MTCPPHIAAVAAVMDEIDQCRNPQPCGLCQQRMQSILDMGAAAERQRIIAIASQLRAAIPADHPQGAQASFADYLRQQTEGETP